MSKEFKNRKDQKKKPQHSLKERRALKHEKKMHKGEDHKVDSFIPE